MQLYSTYKHVVLFQQVENQSKTKIKEERASEKKINFKYTFLLGGYKFCGD